ANLGGMRMAAFGRIAGTLAMLLATNAQAAGPERHVLGPHLQRRLLSSQAPGRAIALTDTADLFVRADSLEHVARAPPEQHLATAGEVRGADGLYRVRLPLAAAAILAQ